MNTMKSNVNVRTALNDAATRLAAFETVPMPPSQPLQFAPDQLDALESRLQSALMNHLYKIGAQPEVLDAFDDLVTLLLLHPVALDGKDAKKDVLVKWWVNETIAVCVESGERCLGVLSAIDADMNLKV